MASEPINLRTRRKQKAREEKRKRTDAATQVAGVTNYERSRNAKVRELGAARLDGRKLEQEVRSSETDQVVGKCPDD